MRAVPGVSGVRVGELGEALGAFVQTLASVFFASLHSQGALQNAERLSESVYNESWCEQP